MKKNYEVQNISAIKNSDDDSCLILSGEVKIYTSNGTARFKEAVIGSNPRIFIVEIEINEGDFPINGRFYPIPAYRKCGSVAQNYEQVTIRYKDKSITVDINTDQ